MKISASVMMAFDKRMEQWQGLSAFAVMVFDKRMEQWGRCHHL